MKYIDSDVENLLNNISFRKWIQRPDAQQDLFWRNWLRENPHQRDAYRQARMIIKSLQFREGELSDKEKSLLLRKIKDTNALRDEHVGREAVIRPISKAIDKSARRRKAPVRQLLKYAAILGGVVLIAVSVDFFVNRAADIDIQWVKKENKNGQKSTIFLSDGTVVTLNSGSSLIYPSEFKGSSRTVKLKGEAFFKVSRDTVPFFVRTASLGAKVLGTSFNARAFPDQDDFSISLVTGKVEVFSSEDYQQRVVLYPGEKATLGLKNIVKSRFKSEDILWKDGVLFFSKTPFKKALQLMERWYAAEFQLENIPEKEILVTGKFENESLEVVLRSLSFTIGFDYKITGNKVHIKLQND